MRNKNMVEMGFVIFFCQFAVLGVVGLFIGFNHLSTIFISRDLAVFIYAGTFLTLVNLLALGLIIRGSSNEQ